MPGAFHTEVVLAASHQIRIYLLDLHWGSPLVTNSSVSLTYFRQGTPVEAVCQAEKSSFLCSFDKSVHLNDKGTLEIKAVRDQQMGNVVSHQTPLQFTGN